MNTIGERLTARREALGMSQRKVAATTIYPVRSAEIGVVRLITLNSVAYEMYESDAVEPTITVVRALGKTLDCAPEWIAFGVAPVPVLNPPYSPTTFRRKP